MKKKSCLICIRSVKIGGGAERIATKLGTKLNEDGMNVYYLTFLKSNKNYEFGGNCYTFNEKFDNKTEGNYIFNFLKRVKSFINLRVFTYPRLIKNFCREKNIDLIISFGEFYNFTCLLSKIFFKKSFKLIISIRINQNSRYALSKNIFKYFLFKIFTVRFLYKKADLVIPVSKGVASDLFDFGLNENKIVTIPNFYNIEKHIELSKEKIEPIRNQIFQNSFLFLNIGRLHRQKGQVHLIKSFREVVDRYTKVKLIIIGEGNLKKYLKRLVNQLNLNDNVYFMEFQSNIFPFLRAADCFVLSSLWEGFPNVIVEALSINLPVISTDCDSGPREILCPNLSLLQKIKYPYYGEYGILVKPFKQKISNSLKLSNEEKILTTVMIKMKSSHNIKKKYSKGYQRSLDFEIENIMPKWKQIIGLI
jgi:glycosyltransferase involved in cell wall biosynthesis